MGGCVVLLAAHTSGVLFIGRLESNACGLCVHAVGWWMWSVGVQFGAAESVNRQKVTPCVSWVCSCVMLHALLAPAALMDISDSRLHLPRPGLQSAGAAMPATCNIRVQA
jgi:hypothetical protein